MSDDIEKPITLEDLEAYVKWHYDVNTVKPDEPQHIVQPSVLEPLIWFLREKRGF